MITIYALKRSHLTNAVVMVITVEYIFKISAIVDKLVIGGDRN